MTQEIPGQGQVVPPAPTGSGTPQPAAGAIPVAATPPPAPPQQVPETASAPSGESVEELRKQIERLRGAQAAADRRAYQIEQQRQQERAQMLAQMEQKQLEQMPDADRQNYEKQVLARRLQEAEQRAAALEWRSYLTNLASGYSAQGVPQEMLYEAAQQAQEPQQAAMMMQAAAAEYWRQKATGQQPAPAPQQQQQPYRQQYQQPAQPVAPPVTAHAAAAQPPSYDEALESLRDQTRKTKEDTTEEAYRRILEREAAQRSGV